MLQIPDGGGISTPIHILQAKTAGHDKSDGTIRMFSSAEYCLCVWRRMSRIVVSAPSLKLMDFYLIFVPFGHDDEPQILRYAIASIYPIGADVRHRAVHV